MILILHCCIDIRLFHSFVITIPAESLALVIHSSISASGCQSLAQQALMGTINSSMQAVQQAQVDLGHVDNLPPLGHDLVCILPPSHYQFIHSNSLRSP